jgi:polar amino acid transport system permease protein
VRGTPLLVQIFLIYYGLPALDLDIDGYRAAIVALGLFAGAHVSEIVRGAVGAVPRGQTDAAKSLGLTFWPRLRYVVLPQAVPAILPPWVNTAVEMVKGTSLVVLVSVSDLLFATRKVAERTGDPMPIYIAAALIYFVVNFGISRFGLWLERRTRFAVAG